MNIELIGQEPCVELADGLFCAEPTDAESCFTLGVLIASGRDAEPDLIEAHKWFNIAASRGHAEGAQMRREIAAQMSDSEIGQAQRAARDWLKAHPLPAKAPAIRAAA